MERPGTCVFAVRRVHKWHARYGSMLCFLLWLSLLPQMTQQLLLGSAYTAAGRQALCAVMGAAADTQTRLVVPLHVVQ